MQINQNKQQTKSYVAIAIFLFFWLTALAYLFFENKITKKVPNFSWAYNQAFHQNWSFFSQPAIYNDELIFVIQKNTETIDSIDVLDELWKAKRSKFNYARENVWDHIMYRQMRKLRSKLQEKNLVSYSKDSTKFNSLLNNKTNADLLHNIEKFGKEIIEKKGIKTDEAKFKILLFTNYTTPFLKHKNNYQNSLEFDTDWKYFQ